LVTSTVSCGGRAVVTAAGPDVVVAAPPVVLGGLVCFDPLELHAATVQARATVATIAANLGRDGIVPSPRCVAASLRDESVPGDPGVATRAAHYRGPRMESLDEVAGWLHGARHVVVLTGAGISTESGIPDFRGPDGVWTRNPAAEKAAHIDHYLADPAVRARSWQNRLHSEIWEAKPNAGHLALAEMEQRVHLDALLTQNIDGLHQLAGSSAELVVELHGNVREAKCVECGRRGPMEATLDRVRAGETDPPCEECGGILKSATISFGEALVAADLERAQRAARHSDVFLAVGTSLGVYPAAALPEIALGRGARLVVMNAEPTPFDPVAHAVVRTPLGVALPALVALL
jgi:NAD-dependent deacetylase